MPKPPITRLAAPGGCHVIIGTDVLPQLRRLTRPYTNVALISGRRSGHHWLDAVARKVSAAGTLVIGGGEHRKTVDELVLIWSFLLRSGCDRHSLVVCLGGGRICDLGGFAAATFMRGIPFAHVPTTVLAQADAAFGGKTGINFAGHKNLVGRITQPRFVLADVATTATLPKRDLRAGFAEIIKHGLIGNRSLFRKATQTDPTTVPKPVLAELIDASAYAKLRIVATDERETGRRQLLNLGHTIGHAIEADSLASNRPLRHGEAVAIGLVAEARLAADIGLLPADRVEIIAAGIRTAGLPVRYSGGSAGVLRHLMHDKKRLKGEICWPLLDDIGRASYGRTVPLTAVRKAITAVTAG